MKLQVVREESFTSSQPTLPLLTHNRTQRIQTLSLVKPTLDIMSQRKIIQFGTTYQKVVFLTPNVHNSDFANAPLLNTSPNVIISHDVVDIPYNAFGDMSSAMTGGGELKIAKIETVVIPNSTKIINSKFDMMSEILGGAFAGCATLTNIIIPGSVEYVGGEAFMLCSRLDTVKYGNGYYLPTENNEHAILVDTNLKADNVTIHADLVFKVGLFQNIFFIT